MRIGMILDKEFPPDSRVENEAVSLIEAGHDVFLFCLSYSSSFKQKEQINGIHVRRYHVSNLTYRMSALAYSLPVYRWLLTPKISDFIRKNQIEIIHVHDMQIGETVARMSRRFHLPWVLDLHENRPEIMKLYKHVNQFPGNVLINLEAWEKAQADLCKKANHVVVVTNEARQDLVTSYAIAEDKITVVPNTIHPDIYLNYDIDQDLITRYKNQFTILYLGDTSLRRGTDTAIKAMQHILKKLPKSRLVLVGNSSADDQLKRLAQTESVVNHVDFEGWQDVSRFPSYVHASDVCISPLKRNRHHDTTFANKLFQYMASGKPVIVSDSTAQRKVVEDEQCGLVFTAENEQELAKAVLQLHESKTNASNMGKKGREAVLQRWNWKQTSKALLSFYNSL